MTKMDLKSFSRDDLEDNFIRMYDQMFIIYHKLASSEHEAKQYKKELEEVQYKYYNDCRKKSGVSFDNDFDKNKVIIELQNEIKKLNNLLNVVLERIS